MGRRIKKNLTRLSSGIAISIIALLSLIVIAGCYDGMLDDIQQKIDEDRSEDSTYTVKYDGNGHTGGEVPVDLTNYKEGETVTVLGNVNNLVKTGNSFTGWNTQANGNGTTYPQGPSLIMGDSNVILYAQWTTNPTYTVTYYGNGSTSGSVPVDTTNYEEGQTVTVLGNTGDLVRTGYYFAGWNTQPGGNGDNYTEGQTFLMPGEDEDLYAKWIVNPTYTVTYYGNGSTSGSVPTDPNSYEEGWTVTVLGNTGNLLRINDTGVSYRFAGWNTQANGYGDNYTQGQTFPMPGEDENLYAEWIAYALRDTGPAGGLIFHDKGYYSEGWRYMEAAPSDHSSFIKWYNGSFTTTGATDTAIGTGSANTEAIVTSQGAGSYAAQLCDDLTIGIYGDWFLPSKDELNQMYLNLHLYGVGGFSTVRHYWSSSEEEADAYDAWAQSFNTGNGYYGGKDHDFSVRAARDF